MGMYLVPNSGLKITMTYACNTMTVFQKRQTQAVSTQHKRFLTEVLTVAV